MRKLDTSAITPTVAFPPKSGTLDHLQLAYQEAITAIGNNLLGASAIVNQAYILYGLVNSGTAPALNVSAGALFYNGEVYLVDTFSFTPAGGQVAVGNIVTTQNTTNADPVTFTDGIARNVHNIRKIVFTSAVAGTGLVDYTNIKQFGFGIKTEITAALPSAYTVLFDQDREVFFASAPVDTTINFDFNNAIKGACVRIKFTYGSSRVLTVNVPAGSTIIKESGSLSAAVSNNNIMYFLYAGKNELGLDEVSYRINQY